MINDFFNIMLPQASLCLFILIELLMSILVPNKKESARFISLIGIVLSIVLLSTVQTEPQYFALRGALMSDSYTLLFHFIILLCGFFVILISRNITNSLKNLVPYIASINVSSYLTVQSPVKKSLMFSFSSKPKITGLISKI